MPLRPAWSCCGLLFRPMKYCYCYPLGIAIEKRTIAMLVLNQYIAVAIATQSISCILQMFCCLIMQQAIAICYPLGLEGPRCRRGAIVLFNLDVNGKPMKYKIACGDLADVYLNVELTITMKDERACAGIEDFSHQPKSIQSAIVSSSVKHTSITTNDNQHRQMNT